MVLHSTRSGLAGPEALDNEYALTINWFLNPNAQASAHRVIGHSPGQHAQLVSDDLEAWHARTYNYTHLGIEFCQPRPTDPFSSWQIETGAMVVAAWCHKYGIIPSRDTIVRHQDIPPGKEDGKTDPGELFPYDSFLSKVAEAYSARLSGKT